MTRLPIAIIAVFLPVTLYAQDSTGYQCTYGGLERRVEIVYETGVTVPCEVHYYKDTEAPGEQQVLWRAVNEAGFCEARTAEFIDKLRGMGWNCQGLAKTEVAEPEPEDDTEALTPADEIEIPATDPTGSDQP